MNENTKITLTFEQLKKLVKESNIDRFEVGDKVKVVALGGGWHSPEDRKLVGSVGEIVRKGPMRGLYRVKFEDGLVKGLGWNCLGTADEPTKPVVPDDDDDETRPIDRPLPHSDYPRRRR